VPKAEIDAFKADLRARVGKKEEAWSVERESVKKEGSETVV